LEEVGRVRVPGMGWEVSTAPDNHTVFVTGGSRGQDPGLANPIVRWWLVDLAAGTIVEHGDVDLPDSLYTAYSPRGDRVAVTGTGGRVELIDLGTGRPVRPPVVGHRGDVYWATYKADGSLVASGSNAGDVSVWDGRTGELLSSARLPGPERVAVAGFRPDGTLTVGSFTGEVYHWDASLSHAIAFACAAAGRDLTRAEWAAELPGQPYRSVCPSED
jgi:WD40 repeat protein